MPDEIQNDLENPPEMPPGAPDLPPDAPAPSDKASSPAPQGLNLSPEQLSSLLGQGVKAAFKEIFPGGSGASPAADGPAGPSPQELQNQIDELDNQIDQAALDQKPIRELSRKRDYLRDQKFEIERVAPLRTQGGNAINGLTIANVKATDPYFTKYEKEIMSLLAPAMRQGQVLNLEIVQNALSYVKGQHLQEIIADEKEADIRRAKLNDNPPMPGGITGRTRQTAPKTPETIRERFGVGGEEAFNAKRQKGYTEDTFARRLGYKDKAEWFAHDDAISNGTFSTGLDSIWDPKEKRWVGPGEINQYMNR